MGAIDYVPHGRLAIGSGNTLRVDDAQGRLLYVWQGSVWLTQEGDSRDHLLQAGDSFQLDRAGTALISSLDEGALISLTPPEPSLKFTERGETMKVMKRALFAAVVLVIASPAWSNTEIERDLDGNASVFQTTSYPSGAAPKTGGSDARR